jgi:uncharacterized protein (TIGR00251 family)
MPKQSRKGSPRAEAAASISLNVRVQPRASSNGIAAMPDGSIKVRLTAPPVDGAANEALVRFLAEIFAVGRSQVEILAGQTGRQKIVRISGAGRDDLERVLNVKRE